MENREFSLHDYIHTLSKRFPIIIECCVLIIFFVMLFSYYQTPEFQAKGKLLIQKDDFTVTESRKVYRYDESLFNYIEIIKSAAVKNKVDVELKDFFFSVTNLEDYKSFNNIYLKKFPRNYQYLINLISGSENIDLFFKKEFERIKKGVSKFDINSFTNFEIFVTPVNSTEILEITVKYQNPVIAEYISTCLYEIFSERIQEGKKEEFIKKIKFIESQMEKTRVNIKEYETKVDSLKIPGKIYNISDDISKLEDQIRDLRLDEENTFIDFQRISLIEKELKKNLQDKKFPKEYFTVDLDEHTSIYVASLKKELVNLEMSFMYKTRIYGDKHPDVIDLKDRIKILNNTLAAELNAKGMQKIQDNPFYKKYVSRLIEISAEKIGKEAKLKAIRNMIEKKELEYKKLPSKFQEYNIIKRELDIAEKTYNMLLEKLNSIKIQEASVKTKVKILDRPTASSKPLKPNYRFNLIIAILSGLLTGITLAFLIEHLDRTVKSPEDAIAEFNLPLYARIPKIKKTDISDTDENSISPMLISYFEPKSIGAEQFKLLMINTKFGFKGVNDRKSTIMVNSSEPAEGKSLICANLAITYAMAGYKTIILDADFHRPGQHKLFNIDNFHGLTDIILGEKKDNILKATPIENLFLLPSGSIPPSPSMFFESTQFSKLLDELKKEFDIVIIDTAPTSNISDSLLIVPKVDNILFNINIRHTSKPIITKTLKDIQNIFDNPIGLVCNNVGIKNLSGHYYRY